MALWITRVIEDAFEVYLCLLGAVALLGNCSYEEGWKKTESHVEVKCRSCVWSVLLLIQLNSCTTQMEQSEILFTSEAFASFYQHHIWSKRTVKEAKLWSKCYLTVWQIFDYLWRSETAKIFRRLRLVAPKLFLFFSPSSPILPIRFNCQYWQRLALDICCCFSCCKIISLKTGNANSFNVACITCCIEDN